MMHSGVSHVIYTDFGQNCGRYVAGNTNALLQYIREQDGGIKITYTDGHDDYVLPLAQGMIDFSMGYYQSTAAAISPTLIATVGHNGEISSNFTARVQGIGSDNTLNYAAIGIQGSSVFSNSVFDGQYHDWRVTRLSKVATDVTSAPICTDAAEAAELISGNNMFYHAGGGLQKRPTGNWPYQGYVFVTGGIIDPTASWTTTGGGVLAQTNYNSGYNGINATNPLPYVALAGDSGSPIYVYDSEAGVYKFWGSAVLSSGTTLATYISFTHRYQEVSAMFNKDVDMSGVSQVDGTNVVYMNAVSTAAGEKSDGTNSTTLYTANITDAGDNVVATHVGLQTGLSTWSDLNALRDTQNWYNYGTNYVAQSDADLFFTENLLFKSSAGKNTVVLRDTVDLGVGYAEFCAAGETPVSYTITSESGESNMLNSAGYIVNENAAVHLQLTSSDSYLYEWRKIGAGDLYIEGSGNNDVLLNIGGSGKTYLNRENGYAAYNVLVNNGATLVIQDTEQIARDLTFGHKGGTLDLNDNDMAWRTTAETQSSPLDGFSINALTEDATIANYSGASTITYTQSGATTYLGSFADSADSSLKVVYDVADGTWTLNSIRTKLQNAASGLEVKQGKVVLSGINTIHGASSNMPESHTRYTHEDDWHYADASMNVVVKDDATFELGSHARLTGDVTVESGGTYVMREGVRHAQEYVEGSLVLEDTSKYAAFYGHKGNTSLAEGATMKVVYSAGTTANNTYAGNITGAGNVEIALGSPDMVFTLGDEKTTSTFSGTKKLISGNLVAARNEALGDVTTNKWVVGKDSWLASHGFTNEVADEIMGYIDGSSTGTLALSNDLTTQLDMSGHGSLYLGAEEAKTVQYGELGTSATLNAVDGAWRLGGGGGTLVVNYVLSGENSLLLGSSENSRGTVHLTNTKNSFTGSIVFNSEGVILTYVDGALGKASVALDYANSMELLKAQDILQLSGDSDGMALVDAVADSALTLSNHANLALGAGKDSTLTGTITVAENQAYRFGTQNGASLTVESALAAGHDVVVDAQGSSGGKVVLAGMETLSGNLTVQGNKTSGAAGDITLELDGDMALERAATVQNGGAIDVAGHTLTSKGELNGNGTLTDSSTAKSGSLVLDMGDADMTVGLNLQLGSIEKNGSGTLNLTGNNNFGTLTVKGGSVSINDSASSAGNQVVLESGTTLTTQGNVNADISMGDGSIISCDGNRLKGQISVQNGATAYYNPGSWYTAIDNNVLVGENSIFYLGCENAGSENLDLKGTQYGQADSGRIVLRNINTVHLINTNDIHFAGTFEVDGNTSLQNEVYAESKLREFDHLQVNAGQTLSLTEVSWNTIWNIHKLTGDGDIRWTSTATHSTPSVMRLDGEGSFSGDITVVRIRDYAARRFQAFVELQHDKAAQNATLVLAGNHANGSVALTVNTDNAHIAGLQNYTGTDASTTNAYVIAGAPPANTSGNDPVTGRSATLTFTGSGEYTFSGKVGHANDTVENSLSLVMNGTGSQTLNGSIVKVNNVSALSGSLNIAPTSLTVLGDVSIAEGAALKLGESFTLGSGQTLSVLDSAADSSAIFNSNLVLGGGDIYFDFLSSDYAALDINGAVSLASGTNGLNINFADNDALQLGVTYQLAAGDWSRLAGKISMFTPEMYKDVTLNATADGLSLLLSMKEGFSYWQGNNSEFGEGKSLVFPGGEGALGHVEITGGAVADAAVFENTSDFTISATDGSTLAFGAMEKNESGALIVNTRVTADSLNVADDFALGGTGTLAVGDVTGRGTLQVQNGAHLQVESAEGAALHLLDGSTLTTTGTQIASDVTLGQDQTTSLVTLDIQGEELSLGGEVSTLGSTTLAVQGTGALNYHAGLNDLAELRLSQNTALNVATTLSTKVQQNGATVNINNGGTWQLADDHGAFDGAVAVNAGGRLEGGDLVTEKSFSLGGSMSYDSFTVQNGGELNLQSGGRLDANNAATIASGGTMNLNGNTLADKVNLENGGIMYGNGGTIGTTATVLVKEGAGKLNAGGGTFNVNGTIGAEVGATLRLEDGSFSIYHGNLNADGGTLELATANISLGYLQSNGTQNIGGTLKIAENVTITANQTHTNYQRITHNVNHLHIDDGKSLNITETSNSWAHQWNIGSVTGAGEITWSANPNWYSSGTSRMRLLGENDFSGTLVVKQLYGGWSSLNDYSMQHLELSHDKAGHKMVISLQGDADSHPGLAINTYNARVAGLDGTANTYLYAGPMKTGWQGGPVSSALNTLTIIGSGEYEFAGTLQGSETCGLNIVMDGTGTQSFTGTGNVVHDVTALRGSLVFTNKPVIHGDIGVAQGASLKMGSEALSLDAGNTLRVLVGAENTSALLNNNLVINGGTIDFSAYNEGAASLALGEGCTLSAGATPTVTLAFRNCGNIKVDPEQVTYKLMDGNWTAIDSSNITVNDCRYLDVSLDRRESGLFASFSLKDGFEYWMSDDPAKWTPSKDNVVITGMEGFSDVINLKADTSIKNGILDNDTTVVIKSDTGNTLQFTTVEKIAGGDLVIDAGVSAGTFTVSDNTRITGTGSLSVGTLNINADLTTGMGLDVSSISIGEKCSWSLDGSERAFTQNLSLDLVNKLTSMSVWGQAALTVTVDPNASLTSGISGTGTLNKTGSGVLTANQAFQIGTLNVEAGGFMAEESVDIGTLNVAGGATVTMWNKAANSGVSKVLGTVTLGAGAIFESNDRAVIVDEQAALQIGTLVQKGETATFRDTHNSGYYVIDTLNSTVDNATLNIVKKSDSTLSTVVKLGNESTAGNFKGKIVLNSDTGESTDVRRSLFLVLGGAQAAAGAVVNQAEATSDSAVLGLGINADNVTIAGLESASGLADRAKVFSGTVDAGVEWGSADAAPGTVGVAFRTLTIDATTDHVFHGAVLSHLNLVKEGSGKQTLSGTSANFNGSITVNEGTLALGNNAMSMLTKASSVLVNEGGALDFSGVTLSSGMLQPVRGEGTVILNYGVSGNGTGFDFSTFGGKVQLNSGRVLMSSSTFGEEVPEFILTSGNSQLVFNGNGTVVKSDVTLNADTAFYVNSTKDGEISGALSGKGLTKEGAGELLLSGGVELAYLKTKVGTVEISGSGNKLGMVDGSMGRSAEGSLRLSKGADLTVSGDIWGRSHSSIVLEEGARLTNTQDGVIFTNKNQELDAALVNNANDGEYSVGNSDFQLTNGYLKYDSSTAASLTNKLTNSVVENGNAGNAKLTVNNSANTLSGLVASGGSMDVLNQAALTLDILEVATGKSVGLYTGADASSEKAAVVVTGSATFGAGAALNTACLTLADGATLEMTGLETGAVTLNGALTFGNGLMMGETLLADVLALSCGESLKLFSGVQGFSLPMIIDAEDASSVQVLASVFFDDMVGQDGYHVQYQVIDNVGSLLITHVPEPTTATLSLLALAALAARRRRK